MCLWSSFRCALLSMNGNVTECAATFTAMTIDGNDNGNGGMFHAVRSM